MKDHPLRKKYFVETETVETAKGYWNTLKCKIMMREGEEVKQIGEYNRGYNSFFRTFEPFIQDGKEYALIGGDFDKGSYQITSVITLPECELIAQTEKGFCPVEFYVPRYEERHETDKGELDDDKFNGQFGFISGCHWGDDSSWKLEYLDLSNIANGEIKQDARFGYIELPGCIELKDAVDLWYYEPDGEDEYDNNISITVPVEFSLKTGKADNEKLFHLLNNINQSLVDRLDIKVLKEEE